MKRSSPDWIICFGDHWDECAMGSPGNLMLEFHRIGYKVLWVNPIPKLNLSLKKTKGNKKVFIQRIVIKIKKHAKFFKRKKPFFIIITPLYWPVVESRLGKFLNKHLYRFQIGIFQYLYKIQCYSICNCTSNNVYDFIRLDKALDFFHIAADMHSDYRLASVKQRMEIIRHENILFSHARLIFTASNEITKKIIDRFGFENKLIDLPHGVDFEHFDDVKTIQDDISKLQKPIIGYFGSLTFANDQDIYLEIAKKGYTLVLVGNVAAEFNELKQYENVKFLGPVKYEKLPSYAAGFDVCIMAWKPGDWINNCNPKKTLEYLALGKPIVSVTIPQVEQQFGKYVYFADTPEEFVRKIDLAINTDTVEKQHERKNEAKKHGWALKAKLIQESLGWQ